MRINNRLARNLWLYTHGLSTPPTGQLDLIAAIRQLGFVQIDTIQVVARAHHHILWSRNNNYREPMLNKLLADEREIFEHFTHDAAVIPMDYLPMWRRQFLRMKDQLDRSKWNDAMLGATDREAIKARISLEGPLSTQAFDTKTVGPKKMWSRPPHKLALDYMWYSGELATSHRKGFTKFYDLSENVFPVKFKNIQLSEIEQIDWLCSSALRRLGVGTLGEVQKFWDAVTLAEVKDWVQRADDKIVNIEVQASDKSWSDAIALKDAVTGFSEIHIPTSRLRILNPFDPAIRDRIRLNRLFGFDYRVEMFVPKIKRKWGYYVYPVLEKDRFVGRIELKSNRHNSTLSVLNIWQENGVNWSQKRFEKLNSEINRLARFISVSEVIWHCNKM